MVDAWKSVDRGDFTCACGAVYSVTATKYVAPHTDRFNCVVCGATIRDEIGTWHNTYRLKRRPGNGSSDIAAE